MTSRSKRKLEPNLGLPDLSPMYFGGAGAEGASRAIGEIGRCPPGVHFDKPGYDDVMKDYTLRNWWCRDCYKKIMKELEDRHG